MKIFNKLAIISVIILYSILLATGCPTPFDQTNFNSNNQKGIGTFSLRITDSQQQNRTIMPNTGADNNRFALYKLEFTGPVNLTVDRTYETIGNAVQLNSGSYLLNVFGYTSIDNKDANKPAAHGSISLTIKAGEAANGNITLEPYRFGTTQGGKGIFDLNINFPDDLNAVEMELQLISPTPGSNVTYNFINEPNLIVKNSNLELNAGIYRVIFTLKKPVSVL